MPQSPKRLRAKQPRESLAFKCVLVFSALLLGTWVMAAAEFYVSSPGASLSETDSAMRLAGR